MRTIIIPLSFQTTIVNTASERIRCDWLLPYLPADKYNGSQNLNDYDVIIYQKSYKPAIAEWGRNNGKLQIVDLTDPIWLYNPKTKLRKMYDFIDGFILSSEDLRINFDIFFPDKRSFVVIDRVRLKEFKKVKVHEDKDPIFVWFGYADNFIRMSKFLPHIKNHELITICERPIGIGRFIKWTSDSVNDSILQGDIVLNPLNSQYLKTSRNKTVMSWALGMPVAEKIDQIENFLYKNNRIREQELNLGWVKNQYDIRISAKEINDYIIYELKKEKIYAPQNG